MLASVAGAVIQAIGRPYFEDGSRTGSTVEVKCDYHSVCTKPEVNMARHLMQAVTLGGSCVPWGATLAGKSACAKQ